MAELVAGLEHAFLLYPGTSGGSAANRVGPADYDRFVVISGIR